MGPFPLPLGEGEKKLFYRHALPEGVTALDLGCGGLGIGVEPDGIGVALAVDKETLVARHALPRTIGVGVAGFEQRRIDAVGREIMVALDDDGIVGFSDDGSVPACGRHVSAPYFPSPAPR